MSNILKGILQEIRDKEFDANLSLAKNNLLPDKYTIVDGTGRYVGDIYDSYEEAQFALRKYLQRYPLAKITALKQKISEEKLKPIIENLEIQVLSEDLRKWFKEKWVRFNPQGKIMGPCARGSESEGKPKCLPQAKAHAIGKKGRKYAASKKRREDPNPERRGPAKNVATKKKSNEGMMEGYILKKTNVEKYMKPGDPDEYTQDINIKDTDYEIINNKTGQVVGTASWTTNDFMGPGALKITMKNGATRYLDIWDSEKGNPQTAFNRFVKDPKTAKKYKEEGVAEEQLDELKCWPGYTRVQGVPAGAPGSCKKKTNEDLSDTLYWTHLSDTLTIEEKLTIIEEYYTSKTIINESNDAELTDYFSKLTSLSETPAKNKKYLLTFLGLMNNKVIKLHAPEQGIVLSKAGNVYKIQFTDGWVGEFPEKTISNKLTTISLFFSNKVAYDKLRTILSLKFDFDRLEDFDSYTKKKTNEEQHSCPHCGGEMVSEELMNEKKDACYYKVKSRYKVWPSAYASGALVKCRKVGAKNWGTKSESAIMRGIQNEEK